MCPLIPTLVLLIISQAAPVFAQSNKPLKVEKKSQSKVLKEDSNRADRLVKITSHTHRDHDREIDIDEEALEARIEASLEEAMKSVEVAMEKLEIELKDLDVELKDLDVEIPEIDIQPIEIDIPEIEIDEPEIHIDMDEDDNEENENDEVRILRNDDSISKDEEKLKEKVKEKLKESNHDKSNKKDKQKDKSDKDKSKGLKKIN